MHNNNNNNKEEKCANHLNNIIVNNIIIDDKYQIISQNVETLRNIYRMCLKIEETIGQSNSFNIIQYTIVKNNLCKIRFQWWYTRFDY